MLKISKDLELPDEAVTQTFGILAKRGVGKTYTASVMTEEMLKNNLHVVVIDPIGVWYGLRSSADGKKAGLPIIIAGGEHADVPINPESGEVLAEMIIDNRLSMVVDISLFRKNEQIKFMTAFAETLYRKNRNALHLVLDEADAFAPQRPFGNEARMLGAIEDIVRRGRARGLGVTMITQRPSVLNKNVLTQIEVLVALRLTAPIDQKAIDEWIKTNAEEGQREEFLAAIGSLPIGTAYFWSPGWLKIFQKVQVRKRETLDSSSTPIAGQEVVRPEKMASVDLKAIRERLEATVEKIESNDPKVLKKQVKDLERQLRSKPKEVSVPIQTVQVEVIPPDLIKTLMKAAKDMRDTADSIEKLLMDSAKEKTPKFIAARKEVENHVPQPAISQQEGISNYAQSLLDVFVRRYPMQITRAQLAILSKRKPRSSAFSAAIKELVATGYIQSDEGRYELTSRSQIDMDLSMIPEQASGEDLRNAWINALPNYERDLFSEILMHRNGITREELAENTERSITSSGFGAAIKTLKKNELVSVSGNTVIPADIFFEGE